MYLFLVYYIDGRVPDNKFSWARKKTNLLALKMFFGSVPVNELWKIFNVSRDDMLAKYPGIVPWFEKKRRNKF